MRNIIQPIKRASEMQAEELERHLQGYLKQQGLRLSPTTCAAELSRMRHFMRHLLLDKKDLVTVKGKDIESYLLFHKWKQHTRYHAWHAVKQFYDYLKKNDIVETNPAEAIEVRDHHREPYPIHVPPLQRIRRMLHRLQRTTSETGLRSRLMVELAYGSGLRRNEIATLNICDININDRTAFILGKGRKERIVPLTKRCIEAFTEYTVHSKKPRTFLLAGRGDRRINAGTVGAIIKKKSGFNAHLLRHACATHMLLAGCSIGYIQELLGHSRTNTTQIYTTLDRENLRQAIEQKHPGKTRSYIVSPFVTRS
jgi:site-specific recombinase XerD